MKKPLLIVVTGCPGADKTTLAHTLAKKIGCLSICCDEIKAGFVTTMRSNQEEAHSFVVFPIVSANRS